MNQKIQLNATIRKCDRKLLRYGILYYSWVKSHKHNCYYLLPRKRQERLKRKAGTIIVFIATLIISMLYFYQNGGLFAVLFMGIIFNLTICFIEWLYYQSCCRIINQLPNLPIAIVNIDNGYLKVRNLYKMPFVQIPGKHWKIDIANLKYLRVFSAYRIYNGNQVEWDLVGYVPSWTSLSLCYEVTGEVVMQLLFVGAKLPDDLLEFFTAALSMKIEREENYSRFES